MRTSARAIPLAVAAVLVFAACGTDEPDTTPIDPVDVGTTEPGDLRAPTPIEFVEGASGAAAPAATAEVDTSTGRMFVPVMIADYVVGDGMPALPTIDTGFVYEPAGEPSAEQAAALAATFRVEGQPQRFDEGFGVWWRVGPTDGSAPTVEIQGDAQQSWYFSSPWASEAVVECAVGVDSEGNEIGDCPEPEPPVGVPSADEAETRAREYMAALGEDPDAMTYETNADPWAAHVQVEDRSGAAAAVRTWSFGFGAEGVLQWASGSSLRPEPVGPYPLIGLDEAVERLREIPYGGFGVGPRVLEPAIATAEVAPLEEPAIGAVEGGEPGAPPAEGDVEGDVEMPGDVVEPLPEPEPITITLVDVQPDLWWTWDVHGAIWLLPAYRFIDTHGGWHVVPAVTDDFLIEVPAPDVVEPTPEPLPAPEPEPVEPEPAPAPGGETAVAIEDIASGVEFYPACGNETLEFAGAVWSQVHEFEYPEIWARIFSVAREQPPSPIGFRSVRVVPPGPGDDIGTLVVWSDGVAWFVSDSGELEAWLVTEPLEYRWEC